MNTMNSSPFLSPLNAAASRHAINVDILVASAMLRSMPAMRDVVLDAMPQSIMANLAGAIGANVIYLTNKNLTTKLGLPFIRASKAAGVMPAAISDVPEDLVFSPRVEAGFEGLGDADERVKLRTLDVLLSGKANIDWIALGYLSNDVLKVAHVTVEKHRPLLSGEVSSSHQLAVQSWCDDNGYIAVDNTLQPLCEDVEKAYVWLVPNTDVLANAHKLLGSNEAAVNSRQSMNNLITQCWPQLAGEHDALARQTKDYLLNNRRWYYLDKLLNIGMHELDTDGSSYWRWVGDKGVRLFLPLRAKGHYQISVSIFSLVNDVESTMVRCFVNGHLKNRQRVTAGSKITIPYFAHEDGGIAELFIAAENSIHVGDRALSISISELIVSWEDTAI
ncbi:hypothetical protein N9V74_05750 [Alteromonas sp.]|nr:hypothetical protein [Alteromonas sp.]